MQNHRKPPQIWLSAFLSVSTAPALSNTEIPVLTATEIQADRTLAKKLAGLDISTYWVSEKLDGIYAQWDGQDLRFKSGRRIHAPAWFTENFPKHTLAGELWTAHGQFERVSGTVRKRNPIEAEWREVSFNVFDIPDLLADFTEKIPRINSSVRTASIPWLRAIPQLRLTNHHALIDHFTNILQRGGEGLMLRKASDISDYGQAKLTIKLKLLDDAEATVIGFEPGRGRFNGQTGALIVRLENQKILRIGSGLNEALRRNPPAIGSQITYRYRGLTGNGLPRFATYWRIRGEE